MGNNPIWLFWAGWQHAIALPGSIAMARWGGFFRQIRWSDLVPDDRHTVLSGGLGEARGLDRATAARTGDGRLAVIYTPSRRPLEIQLSSLVGPTVAATWFEPSTGRRVEGGTLAAVGSAWLTPPFEIDAVLTLETGN
jgi:hypothetical protein